MAELLTSIGIDPSATATGIVILRETGASIPEVILETEIKPKDLRGMERARFIATAVMEIIHEHRPDRIVIEGYSLNYKNASSVIPLVEIGGILRLMMYLDGLTWFDPRASEVKKFAAGQGKNITKDQVMMWVLKRWGHTSMTNNTADAFVLAAMGLAQANRLPGINMEMRKVAGALVMRKN